MAISDYSTTAASNTTISGINVDENCPPAGLNNAIRQMMADLASWYSWLHVVSVVEYGAAGDGVTDDKADIQSAIDAVAAAGGGIVYFPSGNYLISGAINLKPSVSILGESTSSTVIKPSVNSIALITHTGAATTEFFFRVSNIQLSSNSKTGLYGILLTGNSESNRLSNIVIEDIYITGTFDYGLFLRYSVNIDVSRVFCTTCSIGYFQNDCADVDVSNVKIQNGSGVGFSIVGTAGATTYDEGFRGSNLSTNGQDQGFVATDMDFGNLVNCSFTTAAATGGNAAVDFDNCTQWSLTNVEFAVAGGTPAKPGLLLQSDCEQFTVNSCNFLLNTFGAVLRGTKHALVGNSFHDNSNTDISIDATTYTTLSCNNCDSTGVAFSIVESGSSDYNNIIGNTCNGTITTSGANTNESNNVTY